MLVATTTVVVIQGSLPWAVQETREKNWVAVCQPLGLSVEGADREELMASIDESIQMIFTDLLESGELEDFLRSHGWKLQVPVRELRAMKNPHFEVPMELLFNDRSGSARRITQ
jgi:predicted RNase H-like HicB family nuclease